MYNKLFIILYKRSLKVDKYVIIARISTSITINISITLWLLTIIAMTPILTGVNLLPHTFVVNDNRNIILLVQVINVVLLTFYYNPNKIQELLLKYDSNNENKQTKTNILLFVIHYLLPGSLFLRLLSL